MSGGGGGVGGGGCRYCVWCTAMFSYSRNTFFCDFNGSYGFVLFPECNCYGHSDVCVYNETIANNTCSYGNNATNDECSMDIFGKYSGGGVCLDCKVREYQPRGTSIS